MTFRVTYKQDLSEHVGAEAARRWTVQVASEPDEFVTTLNHLMAEAINAGQEITRVVIERPQLQAA